MHKQCLVVAVHMWACYMHPSSPNVHAFNTEAVIYIWSLIAVIIFSALTLLHKSQKKIYYILNKYISLICLMFIMNVAISVFTSCNSLTYCFLCHAISFILWDAITDIDLSLQTRALMVFVFASQLATMSMFPVVFDIHTISPKICNDNTQNICMVFETAHLWALMITSGLYATFNMFYFVFQVRYFQ